MMAGPHALSGAGLALGCTLTADLLPRVEINTATHLAAALVGAAWALAPDADHRHATATRAAEVDLARAWRGILTDWAGRRRQPALMVAAVPLAAAGCTALWAMRLLWRLGARGVQQHSGGHRGATHSLLALAVGPALHVVAAWLGGWALAGLLAGVLLVVARVADDLIPGEHWRAQLAIAAGAVVLGGSAGGVVAAAGVDLWVLPWVAAVGHLAHLLGDQVTHSGIRWLWPWQQRPTRLAWSFRAGSRREVVLTWTVLLPGLLVLAWLAVV